jgi:hypothetical protein
MGVGGTVSRKYIFGVRSKNIAVSLLYADDGLFVQKFIFPYS